MKTYNIKQLIEELSKYNEELQVVSVVDGVGYGMFDIVKCYEPVESIDIHINKK